MEKNLLSLMLKNGNQAKIRISGISMYPILQNEEIIKVKKKDIYEIGDILVFLYQDKTLLVHRLLKIDKGVYYCKGDNAFRLESVCEGQIVGAVELSNDKNRSLDFVRDSLKMNELYTQLSCEVDAVKETSVYKTYAKNYLEG